MVVALIIMTLGAMTAYTPVCAQSSSLTGKLSQYSAYRLEDERLRHHRYEFSARQEVDLNPRLKTVIAGRLWWDPVMMDNQFAVHQDYPEATRNDELYEGQVREAYADYLGDWFRLRVGRQIIDWTDTFAPALVNMVTAVDARHGVSGDPTDYIIPVDAASFSHGIGSAGNLEWMIVPRGVHHRLPSQANGYGYYEYLQEDVAPRVLVLKEESIPKNQDHVEGGVRYRASFGAFDYNVFAYRGHQRDPAYRMDGGLSSVTLTQYYPRVDTYGTSLTWAGEAAVIRGVGFIEPKRKPKDREIFTAVDGRIGDDVYDRRIQLGLGLDYVFSRHLKLYSNHYFIRLDTIIPEDSTPEEKNIEGYEDNYLGVIRVTNQSLTNATFMLDAVLTSPLRSRIIEPSVHYQMNARYALAIGARQIVSEHDMSTFASFRDSDLIYVRLTALWDANELSSDD